MDETTPRTVYVGVCPECSKIVAGQMLGPGISRGDLAEQIGLWWLNGLVLERRTGPVQIGGCKCKREDPTP